MKKKETDYYDIIVTELLKENQPFNLDCNIPSFNKTVKEKIIKQAKKEVFDDIEEWCPIPKNQRNTSNVWRKLMEIKKRHLMK